MLDVREQQKGGFRGFAARDAERQAANAATSASVARPATPDDVAGAVRAAGEPTGVSSGTSAAERARYGPPGVPL